MQSCSNPSLTLKVLTASSPAKVRPDQSQAMFLYYGGLTSQGHFCLTVCTKRSSSQTGKPIFCETLNFIGEIKGIRIVLGFGRVDSAACWLNLEVIYSENTCFFDLLISLK